MLLPSCCRLRGLHRVQTLTLPRSAPPQARSTWHVLIPSLRSHTCCLPLLCCFSVLPLDTESQSLPLHVPLLIPDDITTFIACVVLFFTAIVNFLRLNFLFSTMLQSENAADAWFSVSGQGDKDGTKTKKRTAQRVKCNRAKRGFVLTRAKAERRVQAGYPGTRGDTCTLPGLRKRPCEIGGLRSSCRLPRLQRTETSLH